MPLSLSPCSKPRGGTGWPSRRGRGCCRECAATGRAGSLSCCPRQPRPEPLSLDRADSTAPGCFPRGSFQLLCKLLTGKESDFNGSSPSFSPPFPDWGCCGCNALGPACPGAPFAAGGAQQHPGDRFAGAEHLELLPRCNGLRWAGASSAASTGHVPGLRNTQLAATLSLQGLLSAPSLLDLRARCLPGAAGPSHSPTLLGEERLCRCVALLRLQLCSAPSSATLRCARGFSQPFRCVTSLGGPGDTDLADRAGMLCRRGVALLCCLFLHATCVPGSVRALCFSGPCPWLL